MTNTRRRVYDNALPIVTSVSSSVDDQDDFTHPLSDSENSWGLTESTPQFVRKLVKMLETSDYASIVQWNSAGDAFSILDLDGFTTRILPKLFRHANFSSFVRQLNKYDFHKVSDGAASSSNWTFRHPCFSATNKGALQNIRRKSASRPTGPLLSPQLLEEQELACAETRALREEIANLRAEVDHLSQRIPEVERLLEDKLKSGPSSPVQTVQDATISFPPSLDIPSRIKPVGEERDVPMADIPITSAPFPSSQALYNQCQSPLGVFPASTSQSLEPDRNMTTSPLLWWAIPPRVLLVDDDEIVRRLTSKILEILGCTTDVAIDGVGAVNKMNSEKYDLVLMDIVMPKLDGISATNLIRKFDSRTPIVSMTVNSGPSDVATYYTNGMNDILSKPFTKRGLREVLEKHLQPFHYPNDRTMKDGNMTSSQALVPPSPTSNTASVPNARSNIGQQQNAGGYSQPRLQQSKSLGFTTPQFQKYPSFNHTYPLPSSSSSNPAMISPYGMPVERDEILEGMLTEFMGQPPNPSMSPAPGSVLMIRRVPSSTGEFTSIPTTSVENQTDHYQQQSPSPR